MNNSKKIAFLSVLTAISAALMYISGFLPAGRLGIAAVAGVFTALAVLPYGIGGGMITYAAVALVSFLIVPDKMSVLLYVALLGCYPVLKSVFEHFMPVIEWIAKLVFFNGVLTVFLVLFREVLLGSAILDRLPVIAVIAAGNIVFVLYDFGLSRLMEYYFRRFASFFK